MTVESLVEDVFAAYGVDVRDLVPEPLDAAPEIPLEIQLAATIAIADAIAARIDEHGAGDPEGEGDRAAFEPWVPLPAPEWDAPDMAAATAALLRWFEANGGDLSAIEVRVGPYGRTVHARRAIAADEIVLTVPRELMLDSYRVRTSPLGLALMAAGVHHDHGLLAAFVARERAVIDSPWRAAIDALPVASPGGPLCASAEDLAPLVGTGALAELHRVRRMILDEHALTEALPSAPVSLAATAWARTVVSSRCFRISHQGTAALALIPVADLCDHGFGDATYRAHDESGRFEIVAARAIAPGEEIHLPYGTKSNQALLAGYGFALEDNAYDEATLLFPPGAPSTRHAVLARVVGDAPLAGWRRVPVGYRYDERTRRALSVARALSADPEELAAAIEGGLVTGLDLPWIGDQTEAAALDLLGRAAQMGLDAVPPVPEGGDYLRQMIARYRRGQREILDGVLALVERAPAYTQGGQQMPYRGRETWAHLLNDYLHSYMQMGQFHFG
ncbi:MAG: SET domain-containing protein [Deltaproteobacteria bacterium]|nr:SET domain-containing protein [Deltaproteobacteria bacterium]